jgi:hypothetical protein
MGVDVGETRKITSRLSPAIEHSLANAYDADLEFISDGGECKEALLWLGVLRTQHGTQATLLTNIDTLSLTVNLSFMTPIASETHGHVLYEPDAAVIRAHGIGTLAAQLQASLVAPQIAYLLSEELIPTPFAKAYKVACKTRSPGARSAQWSSKNVVSPRNRTPCAGN